MTPAPSTDPSETEQTRTRSRRPEHSVFPIARSGLRFRMILATLLANQSAPPYLFWLSDQIAGSCGEGGR